MQKTVGLGVLRTVAWYIIGVSHFSRSIVTSTNHTSRLDPSLLPFVRGKSSRIVTAAVLLGKYHSAKNRKKSVEYEVMVLPWKATVGAMCISFYFLALFWLMRIESRSKMI